MTNILFSRRFFPLLITQFLGALNDNLFKNALLTYVAIHMASSSDLLSNVIAGLFILPFFLFSAIAGEVADKYARDALARFVKLLEPVLMAGVAVAYLFQNMTLLIVLMALMGAQSAFFGPVKYALLPQQLQSDELIAGNAFIEASTYGAILAGLILGTLLPMPVTIVLLLIFALSGAFSARKILSAPAPRPQASIRLNPFTAIYENYRFLKKHRAIFQSIIGASWFWSIGAFAAVQIYPLCSKVLSAGNGTITFFLILFSLGVAVGSYACARILKGVINMVYLPLSALGMSVCLLILWRLGTNYPTPDHLLSFMEFLQAPRAVGFALSLFLLAFFGGLYVIPLNAFMQKRAPRAYVATVIAGNNIFNSLGMVLIAVLAIVLIALGVSIPQLFAVTGVLGIAVAVYICALLPDQLLRSILLTVLRALFRVRICGLENFYRSGKRVVLIANHVSLWDGVLMAACIPERITFAITSAWTSRRFMPIIRLLADFYPLDPTNPLSIRKLIELIKSGKKVMIFPEGRITVTGKIMQVYDGAALTAVKSEAKILPIRIEGAEYSTFSYVADKLKCRPFPQMTIHILEARRLSLSPETARHGYAGRLLYRLMNETMIKTTDIPTNLYTALARQIKLSGKKNTAARLIDGSAISYAKLLTKSRALAETLRQPLEKMHTVGLSEENAISFLVLLTALDYLGKNIVIYDKTELADQISALKPDCLLGTAPIAGTEDIFFPIPKINMTARFRRLCQPINASEITFFENGKASIYAMRDLLKNQLQVASVLALNPKDKIVNTVPLADPKGFVTGILLPLLTGADTLFAHTKHQRLIPHLCYDQTATVLIGRRDVLESALQNASPFDFFSLKFGLIIGESLSDDLEDLWLRRFGSRLLANQTADRQALILALNTPFYYKFGTRGQLLPTVHAENLATDDDGFVLK